MLIGSISRGIDTAVVVGLREDTISLQPHRLRLKKGSGSLPDTSLEVSGPPLSLKMRRDHQPSLELWKASLKQPKGLKPKKRKNRSTTDLGEVHGRLHLEIKKSTNCNLEKSRRSSGRVMRTTTSDRIHARRRRARGSSCSGRGEDE